MFNALLLQIKIEKKKDSEPESDIDVDVDSDKEDGGNCRSPREDLPPKLVIDEAPIAVPLRKFEPMPRRQKKINLVSIEYPSFSYLCGR